jgi:predicted nucleic acid-binding protein
MPRVIIADASCLILLTNIGELELLHRTYRNIFTTPDVLAEYRQALPQWISVQTPSDVRRQRELETTLDRGEASAIALALESEDCTVILDDNQARKFAIQLGVSVIGTVGVIGEAKSLGVITSVKPLLDKITKTNFRLSENVVHEILRNAGEL